MRRFVFTLEAALRQREAREDAARKALATALRSLGECERRLRLKEAEVEAALAMPPLRVVSATQLLDSRRWVETLRRELGTLHHEQGVHQQKMLERQQELSLAARDREALTRLRRHKHEAWLRESLAAEQAEVDEVALEVVRRHQHA